MKTASQALPTGNILKPPVAAQRSMSMLSRLLTALEDTEGVESVALHADASRPPFNGALDDANRVTTSGGLGACLQVYIEGHNAVLIDDVGDGRALHLQGAPGHHGRWRYAVERHRPLIGRMDGEVA